MRTTDGGATWTSVAAPPTQFSGQRPLPGMLPAGTGVDELVCGGTHDCWAYGPGLWSTQDGGVTWQNDTIPGVPEPQVVGVAVADGLVEAAVDGVPNPTNGGIFVGIASSPLASDAWTLTPVRIGAGAGPVAVTHLVSSGGSGWLLQVDRVVGGGVRLQDGTWTDWDTSALADSGGGCTLAPVSATTIFAACQVNGWIGARGLWAGNEPAGTQLAVSTDGGVTFQRWGHANPLSASLGAYFAASDPGTAFITTGGGPVFGTFDAGKTWRPVLTPAGINERLFQFTFFNSSTGAAIVQTGDVATGDLKSTLYMTRDAGHTWEPIEFDGS